MTKRELRKKILKKPGASELKGKVKSKKLVSIPTVFNNGKKFDISELIDR